MESNKKTGMQIARCPWVDLTKADYVAYHDREWGVPVYKDRTLFEFLVLEGAQAGLSWYTVLKKRENYRKLLADFEPVEIIQFSNKDLLNLQNNPKIIRNRLKIKSVVNNAQKFLEVQAEFDSFANYIWSFVNNEPIVNTWETPEDHKTTSAESDSLSKDMKKRGFSFVGSTIIYAYMQAMGLVNDHTLKCFRRQELLR